MPNNHARRTLEHKRSKASQLSCCSATRNAQLRHTQQRHSKGSHDVVRDATKKRNKSRASAKLTTAATRSKLKRDFAAQADKSIRSVVA